MNIETYAQERRRAESYTFIFNGINHKLDKVKKLVVKQTIHSDLIRYQGDTDLLSQFFALGKRSYRYMLYYRWSSFYQPDTIRGKIGRLFIKGLSNKFGFQISQKAKISKGLFLSKFGNIVIGDGARLGENCNIESGVYIGPSHGNDSGNPTIGSKVLIGANSIISGKIHIGNNVIVAPGTFVNFDVPHNSIVSGQPALITDNIKNPGTYLRNMA